MSDDTTHPVSGDVAESLADGAELARSRPSVHREGSRVVSACFECRRDVVLGGSEWVHVADGLPLCTMGMADAVRAVVALLAGRRPWPWP